MGEFIQVFNEAIDSIALVPKKALAHYGERGWVPVEDVEPEFPYPGSARKRGNVYEPDDDALEFNEETSENQEE